MQFVHGRQGGHGSRVVSHSQTLTPSGRESGTLPTCELFRPAPQMACKISGCLHYTTAWVNRFKACCRAGSSCTLKHCGTYPHILHPSWGAGQNHSHMGRVPDSLPLGVGVWLRETRSRGISRHHPKRFSSVMLSKWLIHSVKEPSQEYVSESTAGRDAM